MVANCCSGRSRPSVNDKNARPGRRSQSRKINLAPLGPVPTSPFSRNGGRRLTRSAGGAHGSDPCVQLPGRAIPASRRPAGPLGEALGSRRQSRRRFELGICGIFQIFGEGIPPPVSPCPRRRPRIFHNPGPTGLPGWPRAWSTGRQQLNTVGYRQHGRPARTVS